MILNEREIMLEVTLSEQYQIPIPEEIRNSLHLSVGQKFSIVVKGDLISLVPKPSFQALRGILKGANVNNIRDHSDRI